MSWVRNFFPTVFIGLAFGKGELFLTLLSYKKRKLLHKEEKTFLLADDAIPQLVVDLILHHQEKNPYCYVGVLLNSINQGAVGGCSDETYSQFDIQTKGTSIVCINNQWSIYASNHTIKEMQTYFNKTGGVDFIFSPLALLYFYYRKGMTDSPVLYLLIESESVSLAIMNKEKLFYSNYFVYDEMNFEQEAPQEIITPVSMESFDDTLFSEHSQDVKLDDFDFDLESTPSSTTQGTAFSTETALSDSLQTQTLRNELVIFNFVKRSLDEFYKDSRYESEFVEISVLLDTTSLGSTLKELIEDELFLTVDYDNDNLSKIIADMMKEEILS